MKFAMLVVISVILLTITSSSAWKDARNAQQTEQNVATKQRQGEDPTTLRARLKRAKPNENNEVIFSAPEPILADVGSLDQALANFSTVIAKPIDSISLQVDPRNIMTYYKFQVLETLSKISRPHAGVPQNLPSALPPLKYNEIYVLEGGGTVLIDGVKVTQKGSYEYSRSEKYLLFLSENSAETIAMVNLGKYGVFRVSKHDDDSLEPIATNETPVERDLEKRHGKKLSRLRSAIKR